MSQIIHCLFGVAVSNPDGIASDVRMIREQ
jgi:hypothetical protein